ncbi:MAG: phosphate signaling complex protein PhoU [Anaerolineales bacterium]|nr:phosphate signaling complex protein PhoU [Anaerolineales bacterium]
MGPKQNLRATYDREYAAIEEDLLRIRDLVDRAIDRSILSLRNRDAVLAQEIIDEDIEINRLRFRVEEACLRLIATQQPAATDLRAVVAAMSIVVDIERMGDHAAGIAKTVLRMGDAPLLKPLVDIPRMAELARSMLRESLVAFINRDVVKAREIASKDDSMDRLYKAVFDELVEIMANKPEAVERATYLLWCAHNLERIADRVTNIAERVIFVCTGEVKELNV